MSATEARTQVEALIAKWDTTYVYSLKQKKKKRTCVARFKAIFSRPSKVDPVPEAVVDVHFDVVGIDGASNFEVLFTIEDQKYQHSSKDSIAFDERWFDTVIQQKKATANFLNVVSDFESTRLLPPEDVFDVNAFVESVEEREEALQKIEADTELHQMEQSLIAAFRRCDTADNGVLEYNQFRELLLSLDLGIAENELGIIMAQADENDDGLIQYSEFVPIACEILQGMKARRSALKTEQRRQIVAEGETIKALSGVEMQDILAQLSSKLAEVDTDGIGRIPRKDFTAIVRHRRVGLSRSEINMLIASVPVAQDETIEIATIPDHLLSVKYQTIMNGFIYDSATAIESYLMGIMMDMDEGGVSSFAVLFWVSACGETDEVIDMW